MTKKDVMNESEQVLMARNQIIGYCHCSEGYSIKSLVISMGLTKEEWMEIQDDPALKPSQIEGIQNYFDNQN